MRNDEKWGEMGKKWGQPPFYDKWGQPPFYDIIMI